MEWCSCRSHVPTGLSGRLCTGFLLFTPLVRPKSIEEHYERLLNRYRRSTPLDCLSADICLMVKEQIPAFILNSGARTEATRMRLTLREGCIMSSHYPVDAGSKLLAVPTWPLPTLDQSFPHPSYSPVPGPTTLAPPVLSTVYFPIFQAFPWYISSGKQYCSHQLVISVAIKAALVSLLSQTVPSIRQPTSGNLTHRFQILRSRSDPALG